MLILGNWLWAGCWGCCPVTNVCEQHIFFKTIKWIFFNTKMDRSCFDWIFRFGKWLWLYLRNIVRLMSDMYGEDISMFSIKFQNCNTFKCDHYLWLANVIGQIVELSDFALDQYLWNIFCVHRSGKQISCGVLHWTQGRDTLVNGNNK